MFFFEKTPGFRPYWHECMEQFRELLPLNETWFSKQVKPSTEHKVYSFLGSFQEGSEPPELKENEIVDIQGDHVSFPEQAKKGIVIINSVDIAYKLPNVFCRPTFSLLMAVHAKEKKKLEIPSEKSIFFLGGHTYHLRDTLVDRVLPKVNAVKDIGWEPARTGSYGLSGRECEQINIYEEGMKKCLIALSPRGKGLDSSRFYEACYYGRVPVIIGDNRVLGDDIYDIDSFSFRISEKCSVDEMVDQLQKIYDLPIGVLQKRARKARDYYETVVRRYMEDPTGFFVEFLARYHGYTEKFEKPVQIKKRRRKKKGKGGPLKKKVVKVLKGLIRIIESPKRKRRTKKVKVAENEKTAISVPNSSIVVTAAQPEIPPDKGSISYEILRNGGFASYKSFDLFTMEETNVGRYSQYGAPVANVIIAPGKYIVRICLDNPPEDNKYAKKTIGDMNYSCDYPLTVVAGKNTHLKLEIQDEKAD